MKFAALSFANDGESQDKATGLAIRAALLSPNFLFRLEQDPHPDGTGKVYPLTEYQLASRLSYFLWSTMPDEALFAQAKAGTLRQNLDAEVARMLKDPKAISLTKDFMGQWLEIRGLDQTPNVDKAMAASMRGETEHFFDYIVTNNRPITDLLDADYSFVDERLAKLYGIAGVTGDDFKKVQLDPKQRFGLITQASIPDRDLQAAGYGPADLAGGARQVHFGKSLQPENSAAAAGCAAAEGGQRSSAHRHHPPGLRTASHQSHLRRLSCPDGALRLRA
jgi:hypothetical protein